MKEAAWNRTQEISSFTISPITSPIKTLHVISNLSPLSGGPTTVVNALSAHQARAKLDVTVCTTNWGLSPSAKMQVTTKHIEHRLTYIYFPYWSRLLYSPTIGIWFQKYLKFFDIVHIHGLYRFPVTAAAWWARKAGVPYLISPHGSLDPFLYKQSRYSVFLKRAYEYFFDLPNLNHASAIHYTADEEAKRATFLRLRARPVVVPNGIDWESYRILPPRGNFRRRIMINNHDPLILFLGRINFKKGLDLLVPAFSSVAEAFPNARLAIVGPDSDGYKPKVQQWCRDQDIQEKVFFVDYLEPEKVKEAYVDADMFVLPSYTENFGLAVVEAMACGTTVIISNQVNIWSDVKETGAGIVVGLDPSELAAAISKGLSNKMEAMAMGARGRIAAEKLYAWPGIIEQFNQVYRELINENQEDYCQPAN